MKKINTLFITATIVATAIFTSCSSPSEKVENADAEVEVAKEDLANAEYKYSVEVENFKKQTDEKITANERMIADIKVSMAKDKKYATAEYKKQIAAIELKNAEMKLRMNEYKEDGNEKWESFKREFNHDMDELGHSLNAFTVNSKK